MLTRHTVLTAAATGAGAVGFMLTLGWWRSAAPVAAGLLHFLPGYCLTVPGMPYGSPGMGDENDREAYDVFLIKRNGTTEVFTGYSAAGFFAQRADQSPTLTVLSRMITYPLVVFHGGVPSQ